MTNRWTPKLAYYVHNEIKESGALGMIFHSQGEDNFGEVLLKKTTLNVIQFPKELIRRSRVIHDDNY